MLTGKKIPIGIENFEEMRREDFYYVDKTCLIRDLLNQWEKVNLFTRPRRFGKSLNMSMLQYFFGYGCDSRLFDGLMISQEKELCDRYMGKFPVISITLKGVAGQSFEEARNLLRSTIGREALRFPFLAESGRLTKEEKELYGQLTRVCAGGIQSFGMSDNMLTDSLLTLCVLLHRHYGQKAVLLIDEYDVPLDQAEHCGYYNEMVRLIRNLFGLALKTNDSLQFAVLTGCLRLAKESIFTGLNHFKVFSITDVRFDGAFGFTDAEVRTMLYDYGLSEHYRTMKEWYDGYHFGNAEVYCPWDVLNYVDLLRAEAEAEPRAFWMNSSGNEIVRKFLSMAKPGTRREIEELIDGKGVVRKINQELTYRELYKNVDHVWSVLFMTGYLTWRGKAEDGKYRLVIPNLEIRNILIEQIGEWFQEEAGKDRPALYAFCEAFAAGDAETAESLFNAYLQKTISIRDTGERKGRRESFYHGILVGLLSYYEEWDVRSNTESGDGYSDILVEREKDRLGIVIEIKYSDDGRLEAGCEAALRQIEEKDYESRLFLDGMETVLQYGIACYKKRCRIRLQSSNDRKNASAKEA